MCAWYIEEGVRLIEVVSPKGAAVFHARIGFVLVQEEIRDEEVVACAEEDVAEGGGGVSYAFGGVNGGENALGEVVPFGVPAVEVSELNFGHDGEDFGDVGSVVGDGAEGSHGFVVEVEVWVEL